MSWVMVGVSAVSTITSFMGASSAAKAQTTIAKAQADAENKNRQANNMVSAANSAMINTMRAEDTKQKFKAAGAQWEAANKNIIRLKDQAVRGKVNERLKAAEELGSLYASAAFNGIGGQVVDTIQNQLSTAQKTEEQLSQSNYDTQISDMLSARDSLFANAAASMDNSTTFASMDRNVSIPGYVAKPNPIAYIGNFVEQSAPYIRNQLGQQQMQAGQSGTTSQSGGFIQSIKNAFGANTKI